MRPPGQQTANFSRRDGGGEVDVVLPMGARMVSYYWQGNDTPQIVRRAEFDRDFVRKGTPLAPYLMQTTVGPGARAPKVRVSNRPAADDSAPAFEGAAREMFSPGAPASVTATPEAAVAMYAEEVIQSIRDAADRIVVAIREVQASLMARELSDDETPAERPPAPSSGTDRDVEPPR